jgi:ankyrin repeat protein
MRTTLAIAAATAAFAFSQTALPPAVDRKVDFEMDVQPLLAQKCHSCHGDEAQQSGLRLDRRQAALRGGDYGPVIIPGDSARSKLIHRVANGDGGLQMPPTGPLSKEEIGILRAWIDQGADFRIQVQDDPPAKPVDPGLAAAMTAVRGRDAKAAAKMIAGNPELMRSRDGAGATLLHHAAGFGNIETMALLLNKGAEVNAGNRRKSTALFWALHDEAKVRLLLKRGANVNAKNVDGRTPLYQVASMGNAVSVLRLLLDKGADPNIALLNGMTPLMAASRSNLDAVPLLLGKGSDVNAKNAAGATALMVAAQTGRPQAVRMLLEKGADPNVRTKRNETALADAATSGNQETIKLLLDRDVDVNVQDIRGYSALLHAAGSDAVPVAAIKLLLDKGADTNAKADGETAQMLAAKRGDSEVARQLGVPSEERNSLGAAPLPVVAGDTPIADRIKSALELLEKQSHNFIRIGGCNSCHAQDLPSAAAAIARERGLSAPKAIPQLPLSMHALNPARIMDLAPVSITGMGWEMFDFGNNQVPRDEYTDATVRYLKAMQSLEGHWRAFENRRPPMNAGEFQTAALAIYALKTYGPPAEKADTQKAIARAGAWLESAKPTRTHDQAFHLMGLVWANANAASITASAKSMIEAQRPDGGWSQLTSMGSDAYATGSALYALSVARKVTSSDPVFTRGLKYLLRTQAADGSWHVKSRSIWVQPYFESGFPYGHDQWISAAGTSWAVMALAQAVEPVRISRRARF